MTKKRGGKKKQDQGEPESSEAGPSAARGSQPQQQQTQQQQQPRRQQQQQQQQPQQQPRRQQQQQQQPQQQPQWQQQQQQPQRQQQQQQQPQQQPRRQQQQQQQPQQQPQWQQRQQQPRRQQQQQQQPQQQPQWQQQQQQPQQQRQQQPQWQQQQQQPQQQPQWQQRQQQPRGQQQQQQQPQQQPQWQQQQQQPQQQPQGQEQQPKHLPGVGWGRGRGVPPFGASRTPGQPGAPCGGRQAPAAGLERGEPMPVQQQPPQQTPPEPAASGQRGDQTPRPASSQSLSSPLGSEFSKLQISSSSPKSSVPGNAAKSLLLGMPKRSNPNVCGTKGRPIRVYTNMMSLDLGKNFKTNAVHYDVEIDPDRPKFLMRRVFEALRQKHFKNRYPAFDGKKNAYSAGNLPFQDVISDTVVIFDEEQKKQRSWKIKLTRVADIDLSWLKNMRPGFNVYEIDAKETALQVLDVVFRHGPASQCVPVGRSIFSPPSGQVVSLGNGLELWVGVFQSIVTGWKPFMNIDVAHKGFPTPQNIIELMKDFCTDKRSSIRPTHVTPEMLRYERDKINKYLKGLKVIYEIPGQPSSQRTHRVNELGPTAREHKFLAKDNKQMTIEEYFMKEKNYRIKEPNLPCLWIGNRDKRIYVPAELCRIKEGQATRKKMDETQTSSMIRHAATDTEQRKRKIMDGFNKMRYNEDPSVREFGISVSGQFETVPARVLTPPTLEYGETRTAGIRKGVWQALKFLKAENLPRESWTIIALQKIQYQDLENLKIALMKGAQSTGMNIQEPFAPFQFFDYRREIHKLKNFFEDMKKRSMKLVIVVIPDCPDAYSKVKQITELSVGILTQCIKTRTLRKLAPATVGNILLKVNSKLNGINHAFPKTARPRCLNYPCMLVGADVTHPSPDAQHMPSIAAVAASHDPRAFQYNIEIKLQGPRVEIIQEFEEIMIKQILFFMNNTKCPPLTIIYFRDGVSEGQLATVLYYEITAMRQAVKRIKERKDIQDTFLQRYPDWNPPITCIVVQKRHHIRLFPQDPRNSDDRNKNVQAGTIVDTEITHALGIDFYLVSHASIQGTARPTKYRCICNEIGLSEDEIEELTYYLCHMFARCCRSVSYPAPTYYAHLAAFRARALTYDIDINTDRLREEQERKLKLRTELRDGSPMFFV